MSLENPQLEDGHLKIVNAVAEALAHTQLSGHESRALWFLFRKTYGWSKKTDVISLSQWMEGTGLSKSHVVDTLNRLVVRRIIRKSVPENGNKKRQEYWFNKHADQWKPFPKTGTFPKSGIISFPKTGHTTTRKDTTAIVPSFNGSKIQEPRKKTAAELAAMSPSARGTFAEAWGDLVPTAGHAHVGGYDPDHDEDAHE